MRRVGAVFLKGVLTAGRRWLGAVFGAHLPSWEVCVFLPYMCVPLFCFAFGRIAIGAFRRSLRVYEASRR
jgi:hypothetical protein